MAQLYSRFSPSGPGLNSLRQHFNEIYSHEFILCMSLQDLSWVHTAQWTVKNGWHKMI